MAPPRLLRRVGGSGMVATHRSGVALARQHLRKCVERNSPDVATALFTATSETGGPIEGRPLTRLSLLAMVRGVRDEVSLPLAARRERHRDRRGLGPDPGADWAISEGLAWLARAQENSCSHDGGVARHYSLKEGWSGSYPETTGYIVPTLLRARARASASAADRAALDQRARSMLEWLVSLQFAEGAFPGGMVHELPRVPVTFNTGQIILGLAEGVRRFGDAYRPALNAAADWMTRTQDPDGAWRRHPSPFARPGEKAYDTHAAWGLLEAARLEPHRPYADAALGNVQWALRSQLANGWFDKCCLNDPTRPLTHTLGYVLRGVLEAYRFAGNPALLDAARRTADGLLTVIRPDGGLPGRIDAQWRPAASWSCLTGNAQVALCWMLTYGETGDRRYAQAARGAIRFVRRTMRMDAPPQWRGGVKGSFPADGAYGRYQYLNWACKFMIDACIAEQELQDG
jgi:hypothetical protein